MSSTFPASYYQTKSTKITTTAATSILDIQSVSAGRGASVTPVQLWIYNEDGSNSCTYTVERFSDSVSYGIQRGSIAAYGNEKVEFAGFLLDGDDELRITASNANDLVATVTYIQDLGGQGA